MRVLPKMICLAFVALISIHQASAQEFIRLENRWKPAEQIHNQTGPVTSGPTEPGWYSAQWLTEPLAGGKYFRLKNRWKGNYLHNQNGTLELGAIEPGWNSAMWVFETTDIPGYFRVQNLWTKQYLHNENGSLELGAIQPNWWSAQWRLLGFTGEGSAPVPTSAPVETPEPVVIQAEAVIKSICPEGQASGVGGACVTEVFFHGEDGLSLKDAQARAIQSRSAVAQPIQVSRAWDGLGLDVYAFGRLSDGLFAVPVQRDHSNFKKGMNYRAEGGNQGFFYVPGCPPNYSFEANTGCRNQRIKGAIDSVSAIDLGVYGKLTQTSSLTWKLETAEQDRRYYFEKSRDLVSIELYGSDDYEMSQGRTLSIDLYNNIALFKKDGIEHNRAVLQQASDGADRSAWPDRYLSVASLAHGITRIGYGEFSPQGRTTEWGILRLTRDGKWVQEFYANTDASTDVVASFTEVGRPGGNTIALQDSNGQTLEVDLESKQILAVSGRSILPIRPGIPVHKTARLLWTGNQPLPTAEEERQNALIARDEIESNYYHLTNPLSRADLNKVMVWIGKEASAATVNYCYRNTQSRPGYPWQGGDRPLPDMSGQISRCEARHGAGNCETPILVTYPKCTGGMLGGGDDGAYGDGPICWQQCPSMQQVMAHGQHTRVNCGIGCASSNEECALAITDMVTAPINMAAAILTLGLSTSAQQAAKQAATQTTTAVTGGVASTSMGVTRTALADPKWARLMAAIDQSEKIFDQITAIKDKFEYLLANVENLETEINRWNTEFGGNFTQLTSYRIDSIINRNFPNRDDASFIKQKYGQYQLTAMLEADQWRIWRSVATAASFEPLGIVATVDAFAQPMCRIQAEPFPQVTILERSERGAPDQTTRSHM